MRVVLARPVTKGGWRRGGESPLRKFLAFWNNVLDIVQKIWALLRKLFVPRSVPSCLRVWF